MKISVNDVELITLSEAQKNIICHQVPKEIFDEEMKKRLSYFVTHQYVCCLQELKMEWLPKLVGRVEFIPLDDEALAQLIFSQPDYKDRSAQQSDSQVWE